MVINCHARCTEADVLRVRAQLAADPFCAGRKVTITSAEPIPDDPEGAWLIRVQVSEPLVQLKTTKGLAPKGLQI